MAVRIRVRDATASVSTPVHVSIVTNGAPAARIDLTSSEWRDAWLPLPRGVWPWLRDMHRLDVYTGGRAGVELGRLELTNR